jgi:hypothetical protein
MRSLFQPQSTPLGTIAATLYASVALNVPGVSAKGSDVLDYVDPFIGTANGGAIQ